MQNGVGSGLKGRNTSKKTMEKREGRKEKREKGKETKKKGGEILYIRV